MSRLGNCQCCTLKIEISYAMNLAFFWATFRRIQKNISYHTDNFPKQGYKVLFYPLPRCNYASKGAYATRNKTLSLISDIFRHFIFLDSCRFCQMVLRQFPGKSTSYIASAVASTRVQISNIMTLLRTRPIS